MQLNTLKAPISSSVKTGLAVLMTALVVSACEPVAGPIDPPKPASTLKVGCGTYTVTMKCYDALPPNSFQSDESLQLTIGCDGSGNATSLMASSSFMADSVCSIDAATWSIAKKGELEYLESAVCTNAFDNGSRDELTRQVEFSINSAKTEVSGVFRHEQKYFEVGATVPAIGGVKCDFKYTK